MNSRQRRKKRREGRLSKAQLKQLDLQKLKAQPSDQQ